jgi:zinc transporter
MSDGRPLFAFVFHGGLWQASSTFAEIDAAATNADFVWVHLSLDDAATQAWLHARPWPPDVIEMISAPIQRGKLFITEDLIYGHLRDFRYEADPAILQAGPLCVGASRKLLITGRRIPLLSIEELRHRVEARAVVLTNPFGLITEFFGALNDIGEGLLQKASDRLRVMQSKVLQRGGAGLRENLLEMRRDSLGIARDMAYKRTAMLELAHDRLKQQIHRYAALVEDAQEYAEQCQCLLEEFRAQIEEKTNRNLYLLTMFSAIFLPATLIASIWGMNVSGIPFNGSSNGFWVVSGLIAVSFALVAIVLFRFRFF